MCEYSTPYPHRWEESRGGARASDGLGHGRVARAGQRLERRTLTTAIAVAVAVAVALVLR